ncbi:hypothetical protein [Crenobacter luteus]|uniref:Sodium:proline symporter n=1 Tax=Crenobacter luteus TaxID=1452487 RepID=A0A165G5I2_9NEIS|nr:hypothetical protein [Crenobacter luteus]KZE35165.1 hypothetical protein AVW16_05185 [Crenobacter luteus]
MDLHMHSHQMTHRLPDWRAAALAGLAGGVVFLVLAMLMASLTGAGLWSPTHHIAAIVMGPGALAAPAAFDFGVALAALAVHFALAVAMGLLLGLVMAPFHFDSSWGMASLVGAVFGLAVYLVNFYGMTALYPWFAELRGWPMLIAHLAFGVVTADAYRQMEVDDGEDAPSLMR